MIRLDKFIVHQAGLSRSEAAKLIASGKILVNGSRAQASAKINEDKDTVTVNGVPVVYRKFIYIMLNKPSGMLSVPAYLRLFSMNLLTESASAGFPM